MTIWSECPAEHADFAARNCSHTASGNRCLPPPRAGRGTLRPGQCHGVSIVYSLFCLFIRCVFITLNRRCVLVVYFFKDTEPSPLQDSFGVRQQGGLPGPPPVVPTQNPSTPRRPTVDGTALLPGCLRPELFPGIGVLPGPATGSHIVNRGTPVTAAAECPESSEGEVRVSNIYFSA